MKRHKHSLSNYKLLTCDMGQLVPCGVLEVLPGDTFQHNTSALIRVSPLVAPVMHPVQIRIHHFFVPNRLTYPGWENFITGESDGTDYPTLSAAIAEKSVGDYMGLPPDVAGMEYGAMPIRAYNLIFNEWYRDQDLVTEVTEDSLEVQNVAWGKDYFAGARPFSQKGDPVTLPLGTRAPLVGIGKDDQAYIESNVPVFETGESGTRNYVSAANAGSAIKFEEDPDNAGFPSFYADLSAADAIPINDFRKAFALQRYQEARARYGSRYTEYLAYLGIRSSDSRLQRPEYLGGGKTTINFSEVLQTAPDDTGQPTSVVGELKGHGIAAMRSNRYRRFFEEHGHVISLLSVRPKTIYMNTQHRKWNRRFKEDYYQKELEAIGQQEILRKEIFAEAPGDAAGDTVFGYADRYRDYREEPSTVSGEFRDILNYWHLGRDFETAPTLNESFIECVPTKRIHAEQTQSSLWCMVQHQVRARRMVNRTAHARID